MVVKFFFIPNKKNWYSPYVPYFQSRSLTGDMKWCDEMLMARTPIGVAIPHAITLFCDVISPGPTLICSLHGSGSDAFRPSKLSAETTWIFFANVRRFCGFFSIRGERPGGGSYRWHARAEGIAPHRIIRLYWRFDLLHGPSCCSFIFDEAGFLEILWKGIFLHFPWMIFFLLSSLLLGWGFQPEESFQKKL